MTDEKEQPTATQIPAPVTDSPGAPQPNESPAPQPEPQQAQAPEPDDEEDEESFLDSLIEKVELVPHWLFRKPFGRD